MIQDEERHNTPQKPQPAQQEAADAEQELTDCAASGGGYNASFWSQDMPAVSPIDSFASPSMELTDISGEYGYGQTDDVSNTLTGDVSERHTGAL